MWSQLHCRPCHDFMIVSVHAANRGSPPPGPTAIFSMRSLFCCAGLKLRAKRLCTRSWLR